MSVSLSVFNFYIAIYFSMLLKVKSESISKATVHLEGLLQYVGCYGSYVYDRYILAGWTGNR